MHMELQKFGNSKRGRLGSSSEQAESEQVTGIEISGLDLTVSEDRALSALQVLLDRTGYKGNRPGEPLHSDTFQGTLPQLAVSYSDFFDAYGLEPGRNGHHKQEQEALGALRSLAETDRRICYTRHKFKGSERVSDVVVWTGPIIVIGYLDVYHDITNDEAARVQAGEDRPGRKSGFVVTFTSLFVDQIETFHVLKPTRLHQEILQLHRGKRTPRALYLFAQWLITLDKTPFKIRREKLIETLRLDDLWFRQRRKAYVKACIKDAIETALTLHYLEDWQEDESGMFTFELNPQRCKRVEAKRRRALPEPG